MPLKYSALEIAETLHFWIETMEAVGSLCCGLVYVLLGILLTGASIRQNIVDGW